MKGKSKALVLKRATTISIAIMIVQRTLIIWGAINKEAINQYANLIQKIKQRGKVLA